MVSGVVPNVQAALIGCLLMGLLGCVDFASAYRSVDWKTIVLIVGMLPFSIALERTGGVDLAAAGLKTITEVREQRRSGRAVCHHRASGNVHLQHGDRGIDGAGGPGRGQEMGLSPYPFAMIVALAASTAFMTPVSSPVNTLVVAPGQLQFRRLRPHRRAVFLCGPDRQRNPGAAHSALLMRGTAGRRTAPIRCAR